jgi:hypothetical protein
VKTNAEVLNATATTYTRLTDNALETQKSLESTLSKFSQNSSSASTLSAPRSYSEAVTSQASNPLASVQDSVMRKIQNKHAMQYRQFVLTFKEGASDTPRDASPETTLKFKDQLAKALKAASEDTLIEPSVRSTSILKNGAILIEVKDALTAKWIREGGNKSKIATLFHPESYFRERSYPLIFRFVPIEWSPEDPESLRDLEAAHDIAPNTIRAATWVKNPNRRSAEQEVAHIKISCATPETANTLLTSVVRIEGRQVTVTKDSREPTRCNKCQRYSHYAVDCKEESDACGKCGKEHRTAGCTAAEKWCVSCDSEDHSSISRECPQFSKRAKSLSTANPEATLPFFPTDEPWTWERSPPPKQTPARRTELVPPSAQQERKRTKQSTLNFGVNSIPLPACPRYAQASQISRFSQPQPAPQMPWFTWAPQHQGQFANPTQPYAQSYAQSPQQPFSEDPVNKWGPMQQQPPPRHQAHSVIPPPQQPLPASLPMRRSQSQPTNSQNTSSQSPPYA